MTNRNKRKFVFVTQIASAAFKQKKPKLQQQQVEPRNKQCMCFLISHFCVTSCYINSQETRKNKGMLIHFIFLYLSVYFPEVVWSLWLFIFHIFMAVWTISEDWLNISERHLSCLVKFPPEKQFLNSFPSPFIEAYPTIELSRNFEKMKLIKCFCSFTGLSVSWNVQDENLLAWITNNI